MRKSTIQLIGAPGKSCCLAISTRCVAASGCPMAACGHCGGTVMPWRKYFFYLRITAACQQCGRRVRLQGWQFLAAIAVVLLAGFVATLERAAAQFNRLYLECPGLSGWWLPRPLHRPQPQTAGS